MAVELPPGVVDIAPLPSSLFQGEGTCAETHQPDPARREDSNRADAPPAAENERTGGGRNTRNQRGGDFYAMPPPSDGQSFDLPLPRWRWRGS
jgi:hypothetical protein